MWVLTGLEPKNGVTPYDEGREPFQTNNKINVALALAAGLAGGILTRFIAPQPAFAQDQAPVTNEIRAQRFTVVDPSGRAIGTFALGPLPGFGGNVYGIVLKDSTGHVIWSAGGDTVRQVSQR